MTNSNQDVRTQEIYADAAGSAAIITGMGALALILANKGKGAGSAADNLADVKFKSAGPDPATLTKESVKKPNDDGSRVVYPNGHQGVVDELFEQFGPSTRESVDRIKKHSDLRKNADLEMSEDGSVQSLVTGHKQQPQPTPVKPTKQQPEPDPAPTPDPVQERPTPAPTPKADPEPKPAPEKTRHDYIEEMSRNGNGRDYYYDENTRNFLPGSLDLQATIKDRISKEFADKRQRVKDGTRTQDEIDDDLWFYEGALEETAKKNNGDPDELIPIIHGGNSSLIDRFLKKEGGYKTETPMPVDDGKYMSDEGLMFHSASSYRANEYAYRSSPDSKDPGEPALLMGLIPRKYAYHNNDFSGGGDEYSVPLHHADKIQRPRVVTMSEGDTFLNSKETYGREILPHTTRAGESGATTVRL